MGYLFWFLALLWASAAAHFAPAFIWSAAWRQAVQTPALFAILTLSALVSIDLFAFLRIRVYRAERRLLFAAAVASGLIPVVAGWIWRPEDWYQSAMLIRQYVVILLTVATAVAWLWVAQLQPVEEMPAVVWIHAPLWLCWLLAGICEAISTKGGLLWLFVPWKGNLTAWRVANDGAIAARIVLMVLWCVNLRRLPYAVRASESARRGSA